MTDCDYGASPSGSRTQADYEMDPDSTTDFAFDWSADLGTDTIATSSFSLPDGLTSVSESLEAKRTAIFVTGAQCGAVYRITNRVTTTGGRTWDKTIRIAGREL